MSSEEMYWSGLSHDAVYQHESKMKALVEAEEFNLFSLLKPSIFIDGNKWCVLYGDNLQDGIAVFGNTAKEAVLNFNKAWDKPLEDETND